MVGILFQEGFSTTQMMELTDLGHMVGNLFQEVSLRAQMVELTDLGHMVGILFQGVSLRAQMVKLTDLVHMVGILCQDLFWIIELVESIDECLRIPVPVQAKKLHRIHAETAADVRWHQLGRRMTVLSRFLEHLRTEVDHPVVSFGR